MKSKRAVVSFCKHYVRLMRSSVRLMKNFWALTYKYDKKRRNSMAIRPVLVGHRGLGNPFTAELGIPENSIKSIQWAAAHGADIVEGDVQVSGRSSSGSRVMYMMHDEELDRTTNGSGDANARPWSYITELFLEIPRDLDGNDNYDNTPYHPPSFRTWLKAARATEKRVFIELKRELWTEAQVKKLAAEITAQDMTSKTIVAGGATKLSYVKKYLPGAKRSYSINEYPSISTLKSYVGSSGYATVSLTKAESNPTYIKNVTASGIKVFVYTLDSQSHYMRASKLSVYGWMCDHVESAHKWVSTVLA